MATKGHQVKTRPSGKAAAPKGWSLSLSVFEGPDAGRKLTLSEGTAVIGRGDVDLRLGDPAAADRHCAIEIAGAEVRLRDLGTPAGTQVNGKAVTETTLHDWDEIRIGSTGIVFSVTTAVEMAPRAAKKAEPASPRPAQEAPMRTVLDGPVYRPAPEAAQSGAAIYLEVVSGPDRGRVFDLCRPDVYVIGRRSGQVALEDAKCSLKHARVESPGQGKYFIRDLASTNGTFVNGDRATRRELQHMDIVRVGRTELRFICREDSIPVSSS